MRWLRACFCFNDIFLTHCSRFSFLGSQRLFALSSPLPAPCFPLSALRSLLFALCSLLSALRSLLSDLRSPPFCLLFTVHQHFTNFIETK
jgi:hypothetical protein